MRFSLATLLTLTLAGGLVAAMPANDAVSAEDFLLQQQITDFASAADDVDGIKCLAGKCRALVEKGVCITKAISKDNWLSAVGCAPGGKEALCKCATCFKKVETWVKKHKVCHK